jgi:lysophospholipase L1-like esterase
LVGAGEVAADIAVIVLGVNDSLRFHGPRRWIHDLDRLVAEIRRRCGPVPVVIAGVPPMHRFPALPAPARQILGWRSARLHRATVAYVAGRADLAYVPLPDEMQTRLENLFCEDGFHPSAAGYALWADLLAGAAVRMLGMPRRGWDDTA